MSGIKIDIKGLKELQGKFDKIGKDVSGKIRDEVQAFGINTAAEAKRNLRANGNIDEGHLINSIAVSTPVSSRGFAVEIVVAADYAAYVEFGTRKFAAAHVATLPPDWQAYAATFKGKGGGNFDEFLRRIMEWVKRKGFAAEVTKSGNKSNSKSSIAAQESAAYAIALHILRNGVKAHPFLFPAVENNKKILIDNLKNIL